MPAKKEQLTIGGRRLSLSNLDKILYPAGSFTKARVIDYYIRVSKYLLPHLKNRPVTLKRFPNGVFGEFFYEKDAPASTPDWVETFRVPRKEKPGGDIRYVLINDLPTLVWLANLANLEIHPFLHRVPQIGRPTAIVFDCDPGEGADILTCARVALMLREVLSALELKSFVKVSGSKGLQVYVPLNTPATYEVTRRLGKGIAKLLAKQEPKLIIAEMAKQFRAGKVFIDWSQNSDYKTTVGVYSLRAKTQRPHVSLPIEWDELTSALKAQDADQLYFEPEAALTRVEQRGDLFKPLNKLKQNLPKEIESYLSGGTGKKRKNPASLQEYDRKRNFERTSEPAPAAVHRSRQGSKRRYVIQKHAASHLHYDFRLEMHDVLKSWALPKGPPVEEDEKRLAMGTEDHPIAYLDFEGIIPKGQYGGGTVMVWDIGTYELLEGNYYNGFLRLYLSGVKLKGEWMLKRMPDEARNKWQLIKTGGKHRPISKLRDDSSALSKRTMAEIYEAADARWESNRANEPELKELPAAQFKFIEPMLAKAATHLPEGENWYYELKLDGYRALVMKHDKEVTLFSRRGKKLNDQFPGIPGSFGFLAADTILDGEIVALDDKGRPSFAALRKDSSENHRLYFYAFDLIAYRGKDLRELPLLKRRELLEKNALADMREPVRLSATLNAPAQDLVRAVRSEGLEGIVAKRLDSRYEAGERTGAWVKFKTNQSQALVIGGYKPGPGIFESLLVGYYEGKDLMFVGKIKNGFVPALRRELAKQFKGLETAVCPFANLPEPANARRGEALTADAMKKCRWLKPKLVGQIEYTEWTEENHLRHSKYAGLREDKNPQGVTRGYRNDPPEG